MTAADNTHVNRPPPICKVKYPGRMSRSATRRTLLNESEPGPSAGKGAFLMLGYCKHCQQRVPAESVQMGTLN